MKARIVVLIAGMLLVHGLVGQAADLAVAAYYDLAVERLQLAIDTWQQQGRSPTDADEARLWARYGTTARAYYTYAGAHRREVRNYLETHPEVGAELDRLQDRLRALLAQMETRR